MHRTSCSMGGLAPLLAFMLAEGVRHSNIKSITLLAIRHPRSHRLTPIRKRHQHSSG